MKKIITILLSAIFILTLAACGTSATESLNSDNPAVTAETPIPAGDTIYYEQIIRLDFFGSATEITFVEDSGETVFYLSYTFAGNDLEAYGEIQDGYYVITRDDSGFVKDAAAVIFAGLGDQWTDLEGNTVTMEPALYQ